MNARVLLVGLCLSGMGCRPSHAQPAAAAKATKAAPPAESAAPATAPRAPADAARLDRRVAKVGDYVITVGEVEDRINRQSPFLRSRYADPEQRMEFLENMIRFELLAAAAKQKGYDDDPEVRRQVSQMTVQVLTRRQFDEAITAEAVTDEEIRAYYDSHQSDYVKPAMVRASHVQVADEARARELLEEARREETDNRAFRRLAQESSEDEATRSRGGDLRYFPRDGRREEGESEVPREIADAAFALKNVGDVAPRLVKTSVGWHVVKLTGRRDPIHRSVEEVSPQIRNRLWREKRNKAMEDFVANLRETRPVEIHEELLNLVKVNPPPGHGGGHGEGLGAARSEGE